MSINQHVELCKSLKLQYIRPTYIIAASRVGQVVIDWSDEREND